MGPRVGWSQSLLGPLAIQGLVFSIWPLAHLFCALVTYESPSPAPVCPRHSLLSCWHSGFYSTLVWDHPLSLALSTGTSQSCLQGWDLRGRVAGALVNRIQAALGFGPVGGVVKRSTI